MANGQSQEKQPAAPDGWVIKKNPDGSSDYYPDDVTNSQIHQDTHSTVAAVANTAADPNKFAEWLAKPKISPEAASNFWAHVIGQESIGNLTEEEKGGGAAGVTARAKKVTSEVLGDVTSGLTSGTQIALTAASLGDWAIDKVGFDATVGMAKYLRPLLKTPGYAASAYFGLQGLGAAIGDKQPGETDDQVLERRVLGAAAFLGSAHAAGTAAFSGATRSLVRSWGLTPELAEKVSARVAQLEKINSDRDLSLASIDAEKTAKLNALDASARRQVASVEASLEQQQREIALAAGGRGANFDRLVGASVADSKGRLSELQREQLHTGSRIVGETVQAVRELEGDRSIEGAVKKPFREIGEQIKAPIASQEQVYQLIESKLADRGIQTTELPSAATKALGKREAATAEQVEGLDISRFMDEVKTEGRDVSFNDVTRIREDLWQAAESSKDANVSAALKESAESLSDMQEKAADKANLGPKYRQAKSDYMVFRRGIGSGMIRDWLSAEDVRNQDMLGKVAKLIQSDDETSGGQTSRAIRTALKAAGINTKPLDDLDAQIAAEQEVPKRVEATGKALKSQSESEASAQRREAVEAARTTKKDLTAATVSMKKDIGEVYGERAKFAKEQARKAETEMEKEPVIGRYKTRELQGKSLDELYRLKMQEVARKNGNIPVSAYVMLAYGLLKGSPFMFLYGASRMTLPMLLKSGAFQDWAIENAGLKIGTPEANRFRSGLVKMGPALQKAAARLERSGIPQTALISGEKARKASDEPPTRDQVLQPQ